MKHNEEILNKALQTYGIESQLDMLVEECSELIQAVCKLKRTKIERGVEFGTIELIDLWNEQADVYIMMKQMEIYFDSEQKIQNSIDFKEQRLAKRLSDAK
jgi:NTP pyrophosphatase (non-canonical NTP hydrolase)